MTISKIDRDAAEFGLHVKQGGWRLGLLVARNVVNNGPGRRSNSVTAELERTGKTSAETFAKKSGMPGAGDRILRYLKAWDAAAADEIVPASAELVPGEELDGLEIDNLPSWTDYYDGANVDFFPGKYGRDPATTPAYAEEAAKVGVTTGSAIRAGSSKGALAAAIKADPKVAAVAREAIAERDASFKKARDKQAGSKQDAPIEQFSNLHVQLRSAKRALTEALGYVIDIRGVTDTDEVRAAVSGYVGQLRHVLDLIDEAAQGKSLDDELAELLMDEDLK
jgi:hypothetical protein